MSGSECLLKPADGLLEVQRDWTRHETYSAARAIVVENGGGYGMGLAYAQEMITRLDAEAFRLADFGELPSV